MVRAVLIIALLFAASCYSFRTVPPHGDGADESSDTGVPDGGEDVPDAAQDRPECDGIDDSAEECDLSSDCGAFIACVCNRCVEAEYLLATIDYSAGDDLTFASQMMAIGPEDGMVRFDDGGEFPILEEGNGEIQIGDIRGYGDDDRDVMAFVDHDASNLIFAVRRRYVDRRRLEGEWSGVGIIDDEQVRLSDLSIDAAANVESGTIDVGGTTTDLAQLEFGVTEETGEADVELDSVVFSGQISPDADLILLSAEGGIVVLGRHAHEIGSLAVAGEWRAVLLDRNQETWTTAIGTMDVDASVNMLSGSLDLHRPADLQPLTPITGVFTRSGATWDATFEPPGFDEIASRGFKQRNAPLLVGSPEDAAGITMWFGD